MLQFSSEQVSRLAQSAEACYRARLAGDLRRDLGEYVCDLTPPELDQFVAGMLAEARALGFTTEADIAAFARPCVVYGALSHHDPLFEALFYAPLPGRGARRLLSAPGVSAATRDVLATEFARRTGPQLVAYLAHTFLGGEHPPPDDVPVLARHFPERAGRLRAGLLAAHLALAAQEADALGLADPEARRVHGDVAQLLGACFARDPLYPWAARAYAGADGDARRTSRLRTALRLIAGRVPVGG